MQLYLVSKISPEFQVRAIKMSLSIALTFSMKICIISLEELYENMPLKFYVRLCLLCNWLGYWTCLQIILFHIEV